MSQRDHRDICSYYLQGRCRYGSKCRYVHDRHQSGGFNSCIEYVPIPKDLPVGLVVGHRGENIHRIISELKLRGQAIRLEPSDRNGREIKVIARDMKQLPDVRRKLEHLFASHFYFLAPSWTFLHPGGITVHSNTHFKFCKYEGYLLKHFSGSPGDYHELLMDNDKDQDATAGDEPFVPQCHDDVNTLGVTLSSEPKFEKSFIVISGYSEIVKKLQEGLEWIRANVQDTREEKLEARFGRKIWHNLPPDYVSEGLGLKELEDFFYSNSDHRCSMNTSVEHSCMEDLVGWLKDYTNHTVETYHLSTTIEGGEGDKNRVDVRVMLTPDGTAKILGINQSPQRVAIFDILCPQRKHDFRLELGLQKTVHKGDPYFKIIQDMVKTVSSTVPEQLSLVPYTGEWSVNLIRHKKRTSFLLDDTYMATISCITELDTRPEGCQAGDVVTLNLSEKEHWEVELCDVQWEPEFRMEAGVSSKEALCLYLEHPFVDDCPAGKAQRHDTISQEDLHKMFEKLDVMSHLLEQI